MSSVGRLAAETAKSERYRYSRFKFLPKKEHFLQFLALTKLAGFVTFSKVTFSSYCPCGPKRKTPLHGAEGEPSFGLWTKIHPVRLPKQTPDHRSGQMVLTILINKNVLGVAQQFFFFQNGLRPCAPKCAKACLHIFFRTAKKYASQSSHATKHKKACKSHFRMAKMTD